MKKLSYLLSQIYTLYRDFGISGLFQGVKKYIRHGSCRHDLIGIIPSTEHIIRLYITCARQLSGRKYTDADPFKILWISPDQLKYEISHTDLPRRFGRVCSGDWDTSKQKFSAKVVYQSLENHFIEEIPWEETQYYKNKHNKLRQGKPTRGCSSIEDLPQYFVEIDKLYSNIVNEGYHTQQTLRSKNPSKTIQKNLDAPTASMNEIGISIGRDGTLFHHYRGVHRLAIAKIAAVDQVPVQVLVRHDQWQSVRDRINNTQTNIDFASNTKHPDLDDIL